MSQDSVINTLFIGNPGKGKSTYLNALLGEIKFKSGISLGRGLTEFCQIEVDPQGNRYIDTPGFSDVCRQKEAGQEIEKALKLGGLFKILFFLTLEEGRVLSEDKATMKLVLESTPIGSNYVVVINKLKPEEFDFVNENLAQLIVTLNQNLPPTSGVFLNKFIPELSGKNNYLIKPSEDFLDFYFNDVPLAKIEPQQVKSFSDQDLGAMKEDMGQLLHRLEKDNAFMREHLQEQRKVYENMERTLRLEAEEQKKSYEEHVKRLEAQMQHLRFQSTPSQSSGNQTRVLVKVILSQILKALTEPDIFSGVMNESNRVEEMNESPICGIRPEEISPPVIQSPSSIQKSECPFGGGSNPLNGQIQEIAWSLFNKGGDQRDIALSEITKYVSEHGYNCIICLGPPVSRHTIFSYENHCPLYITYDNTRVGFDVYYSKPETHLKLRNNGDGGYVNWHARPCSNGIIQRNNDLMCLHSLDFEGDCVGDQVQ